MPGICKNHPGQPAIGMCESCHCPICAKCAVTSDVGVSKGKKFCSEEHRVNWENYMMSSGARQVKRLRPPPFLAYLAQFAFLLAVIWVILRLAAPDMIPGPLRFF